MTAPSTGYSGTPLAAKLGYKARFRVVAIGAPADYRRWLEPLPAGVVFARTASDKTDLVHLFVTEHEVLARQLETLRRTLRPDASLWVSWPKKSARVSSTVTEDTIRRLALPLGFVDIKVCAVSEVWSGLKLVLRKELRPRHAS